KTFFSKRYSSQFGVPLESIMEYFNNEHKQVVIGKADFKQALKKYLEKWLWKGTVEELMEYWFSGENEVNQNLVEVIKKLREKNILCAVATNQVQERTDYLIKNVGFGEIFDQIYSSCFIGFKKPQREFFDDILKELNLKPEEIMFWDDTQENIDKAKELGFQTEFYTNFEGFLEKTKPLLST
ncbi:HAD-IA family hydrolase, partial [Candidatus Microgenomates bacterium]|nr:HAD-IA family hydrolase [Candidatus Microgenomates bacterium]